jgi:hypothetical protein
MPIHKRTRFFLITALATIILAVAGWQFYKYDFVQKKIARTVREKTKGLYILKYDHLVFDEVAGRIHVRNIDVRPDTAIYQQLVREKKDPHLLLQLQFDSLDITGVKTPKALLNKELEGGKVELTGARIRIMVNHFKKDSSVYNPTPDLAKQLLGKLLKIAVDSVQIRDAAVVIGSLDNPEPEFRGDKVSLLLTHLLIDSTAGKDSTTILFSRELSLDCRELHLPTRNKRYTVGVANLSFTSKDNTLRVAQVSLKPHLSEAAFAAALPVQKDRYDFLLKDIALRHIDRKALWRKSLRADSLVIGESAFRIYRDLSRPPDTTSKVGKYPQQQLMRLPFPLSIGRIILTRSFIQYKEKNAKSHNSGSVQFHDVRASIQNLTNRREDARKDNRCIVDFHAKFLDKAPVDARLTLILRDPRGRFTIDGNIGGLDATALNPLTEPMALTRLEKGRINQLRFAIDGTDSSADGRVALSYRDIKVSMLKKDQDQRGYDKRGLISLFANFVVKNSSPADGPDPKEVHFRRIVNKSIFNLIWKTMFTGVKKSAGMK